MPGAHLHHPAEREKDPVSSHRQCSSPSCEMFSLGHGDLLSCSPLPQEPHSKLEDCSVMYIHEQYEAGVLEYRRVCLEVQ